MSQEQLTYPHLKPPTPEKSSPPLFTETDVWFLVMQLFRSKLSMPPSVWSDLEAKFPKVKHYLSVKQQVTEEDFREFQAKMTSHLERAQFSDMVWELITLHKAYCKDLL